MSQTREPRSEPIPSNYILYIFDIYFAVVDSSLMLTKGERLWGDDISMEYIITTLQLSTKKASLIVSLHKNPPAYHFRIILSL